MKKLIRLMIIPLIALFLSGCDNSLNRADRTVTLTQDNINAIINELNEIQLLESDLQGDFEETLNQTEDLSAFKDENAPVYQNINARQEHLDRLNELIEETEVLIQEYDTINKNGTLPEDEIKQIQERIQAMIEDLNIFVQDYSNNLALERQTFQTVSNPDIDHNEFFDVFDNINILFWNNKMNLEKVIAHFEPINVQLVNFKVYLTNEIEGR